MKWGKEKSESLVKRTNIKQEDLNTELNKDAEK